MKLENWFISNLDDSQRKVIVESIDKNIIVKGAAGSGKTNLAIHRANQAKAFGNYAICIYTIALKRMIAYGMDALGLDKERIVYEWEWNERGYNVEGFVYWKRKSPNDAFNRDVIYLTHDGETRKFLRVDSNAPENALRVSIDFDTWVDNVYYCAFGRRTSWFYEVPMKDDTLDVTDTKHVGLVPNTIVFRKMEDKIDYLIIDEAQDLDISTYTNKFLPKVGKSMTLFGDNNQKIYANKGASMDELCDALKYDTLSLNYNYRLPKSIARMAQNIPVPPTDLISCNRKDGGNSDYPNYPKPTITIYSDEMAEMNDILNQIKREDLDDVAILVPTEEYVKAVYQFLKQNDISSQVHYRTGRTVPYQTINTLDFSNNELPCILTYHAAKGSEFSNVFIPFATQKNLKDRNAFYVACTRASNSLHISFSGQPTDFLSAIEKDSVVLIDKSRIEFNVA